MSYWVVWLFSLRFFSCFSYHISIKNVNCNHIHYVFIAYGLYQRTFCFTRVYIKHKLCYRYANVPCVIIHGALKGSTYEVGDVIDDDQHYGEWNAVLINGDWRFINAYWGTCAEGASSNADSGINPDSDSPNRVHYACDENYFLTDPDQMVATHLPKSPRWQLKTDPISAEEFEKMTFVKDRYFNLKLRTLTHRQCLIESSSGEVEIKFVIPKSRALDIDFQHLLFRINDNIETR